MTSPTMKICFQASWAHGFSNAVRLHRWPSNVQAGSGQSLWHPFHCFQNKRLAASLSCIFKEAWCVHGKSMLLLCKIYPFLYSAHPQLRVVGGLEPFPADFGREHTLDWSPANHNLGTNRQLDQPFTNSHSHIHIYHILTKGTF